jgi:hypothetical protein
MPMQRSLGVTRCNINHRMRIPAFDFYFKGLAPQSDFVTNPAAGRLL